MRFIRPNAAGLALPKGKAAPGRPQWIIKWIENQGKWIELECGCIIDLHIPQALTRLIGEHPEIGCEEHGFQRLKRSLTMKEVMKRRIGLEMSDDNDPDGLFPLF